jgi:VWFA-related protein
VESSATSFVASRLHVWRVRAARRKLLGQIAAVTLLAAYADSQALSAAQALQWQPTFRSDVELLRIDVSVVDSAAQSVSDLAPSDFVVTVDGAPRKVVFANYYGSHDGTDAGLTGNVSFATNRSRARGRVVVFVADLESILPGSERVLLETASTLADALGPADAAGLLPIQGKSIELSRDHVRVREAIKGLRGAASRSGQWRRLSMSEAEAIERRDRRVLGEVAARECRWNEPECRGELVTLAPQILMEADRRIQIVTSILAKLYEHVRPIDAPKTIVLLSAGLPFRMDSWSRFKALEEQAASSGTTTYVVQIAQTETDASSQRTAGTDMLPAADLREGLSHVAAVTHAALFEGVSRAEGVFDRIRTEVTNSWQLGIEPIAQDSDGKLHRIGVRVARPGLTVRARDQFVLTARPARITSPIDVLSRPVDATDLPISVSAFTARGSEAETLKEIVAIEVNDGAPPTTAWSYAFTVMAGDRVVFKTADRVPMQASGGRPAVTATQLPPGTYQLRVAAVDADGRAGSVEMPLRVALHPARGLQTSDIFVGRAGAQFVPASRFPPAAPIASLLEVYGGTGPAGQGPAIEFQLRRQGADAVVARALAVSGNTDPAGRRIAEGELATDGLQPGLYVVTASIRIDGNEPINVERLVELIK